MPVESCTLNLPALLICIYQPGPAKAGRCWYMQIGKEMAQ